MSNLFEEFEGVSAKAWKQKIQADLKGADYNDTLVWQSPEGIHVKPFYHPDDFDSGFDPIPGHPDSWRVTQQLFVDDVEIANKLASEALDRGAEALFFTAENSFDLVSLFSGIDVQGKAVYFKLSFLDEGFFKELISFLKEKDCEAYYNIDIIGNLCRSGNWFENLRSDHEKLERILTEYPTKNMLGVDAALYQEAGANIVQQLAYSLAHANEYLNHFREDKQLKMHFNIAIGNNYFFEIAKIRALRVLYAALASEYNMPTECSVYALPSARNKSIYDYNVNMLRTTTECMSAILGGANAVSSLPYDSIYHKSNEFGERISRNQLLILKSESYFDMVSNPADGTYYIETLTKQLAEDALGLFKEMEAAGGFLTALKSGTIQKKIKESAEKEQQAFDAGEIVLLGANKHPNPEDRMDGELELYPFVKQNPRKTLIEPIIPRRLAEKLEQDRLAKEKA